MGEIKFVRSFSSAYSIENAGQKKLEKRPENVFDTLLEKNIHNTAVHKIFKSDLSVETVSKGTGFVQLLNLGMGILEKLSTTRVSVSSRFIDQRHVMSFLVHDSHKCWNFFLNLPLSNRFLW